MKFRKLWHQVPWDLLELDLLASAYTDITKMMEIIDDIKCHMLYIVQKILELQESIAISLLVELNV